MSYGKMRLAPIRTGKHNVSYWVDSNRGRFVLRVAPPDDAGFLFYERLMMRQEPIPHKRDPMVVEAEAMDDALG